MTDTETLMRTALELIGIRCADYTGPYRCTDDAGRSPYARYGAEQWCDQCIARTALEGTPFPARGVNPNIKERP